LRFGLAGNVIGGISMINLCIRSQPTVADVPAIAAPAAETSSDEILIERVAAGDKLAMQALFARHRTSVYRWLLRLSEMRRLPKTS
jgi:hypothetical protein